MSLSDAFMRQQTKSPLVQAIVNPLSEPMLENYELRP